jgi:hypothetical protein
MKKLIVMHGMYGHIELAENDVVTDGKFKGLNQDEMFEKIMKDGYGDKVPAIFHAEFNDGSTKVYTGKEAKELINNPDVNECTVIAPIAGG